MAVAQYRSDHKGLPVSIKQDEFRYNLSQNEAEIRQMTKVGISDDCICRFLHLTPPQYAALKRSMRKKVWLSHEQNKKCQSKENTD